MGAVDTTYTFTATDTITSTKMNNIIDQTTMTTDAIIGTTLDVASGKLKVRSAGITSNEIADGEVTSVKIRDGTIVNDDINASAAIELSKLATGALPTAITIASANIVNGTIVADDIANAIITAPKLDGAQSGSAPIFGVRAWVVFNGASSVTKSGTYVRVSGQNTATISIANHGLFTDDHVFLNFASGTVDGIYKITKIDDSSFTVSTSETTAQSGVVVDFDAVSIISSGNVSNISKTGTGRYIVNFSTPLIDNNYLYNGSAVDTSAGAASDLICGRVGNGTKTSKSIQISVVNSGNTVVDTTEVCFSFIG